MPACGWAGSMSLGKEICSASSVVEVPEAKSWTGPYLGQMLISGTFSGNA